MLTGGSGYVFGTLFGVMVLAVTQVLIQFIGSLSSWWTRIVIGLLTFTFIGVQTLLANRKVGPKIAQSPQALAAVRRKRMRQGIAVGAVFVLALFSFFAVSQFGASPTSESTESAQCQVAPFREAEAESLIQEGAVIVYHRTAGPQCVDQLYAIFPDGRVTGSDGVNPVEKQVPLKKWSNCSP